MTLLDKDYTPELLSMEQYHQAISLEAGVVASAVDTLSRYLPGLVAGFKGKVETFTTGTTPPPVELSKNQKKAFAVLRSLDFMTLGVFPVYVQEGFNGNLVEFVPVLDELLKDMSSVQQMVSDYRVFLSAIISDRNARKSLNDAFRKYKDVPKKRAALNSETHKFFKTNSLQGKKKFSEVFSRNSEAENFIMQMGRIKHSIDGFPLGTLRNEVDQCVALLDIFVLRLESGDIGEVSGEVAASMSDMAYLIATEVQEVALNYHRINIFVTTANSVAETLAKINPNE